MNLCVDIDRIISYIFSTFSNSTYKCNICSQNHRIVFHWHGCIYTREYEDCYNINCSYCDKWYNNNTQCDCRAIYCIRCRTKHPQDIECSSRLRSKEIQYTYCNNCNVSHGTNLKKCSNCFKCHMQPTDCKFCYYCNLHHLVSEKCIFDTCYLCDDSHISSNHCEKYLLKNKILEGL